MNKEIEGIIMASYYPFFLIRVWISSKNKKMFLKGKVTTYTRVYP